MSDFTQDLLGWGAFWLMMAGGALVMGIAAALTTLGCCILSLLAERRHQQQLELMDKAIELEKAGKGNEEPQIDSRPGLRDSREAVRDDQGLPDGTRTSGSVRDLLRDLQGGTGEVRDGAGEDAASAPANE